MLGWLTEDKKLSSQWNNDLRRRLSLERKTCFTATSSPVPLCSALHTAENDPFPIFRFRMMSFTLTDSLSSSIPVDSDRTAAASLMEKSATVGTRDLAPRNAPLPRIA